MYKPSEDHAKRLRQTADRLRELAGDYDAIAKDGMTSIDGYYARTMRDQSRDLIVRLAEDWAGDETTLAKFAESTDN